MGLVLLNNSAAGQNRTRFATVLWKGFWNRICSLTSFNKESYTAKNGRYKFSDFCTNPPRSSVVKGHNFNFAKLREPKTGMCVSFCEANLWKESGFNTSFRALSLDERESQRNYSWNVLKLLSEKFALTKVKQNVIILALKTIVKSKIVCPCT